MTKRQDVNKCRRQEKCKMAALIRQANKWVRNGQYAKDKKERMHGEKEGEKREKTTLSGKKEEASNVSEQRDKGWIHVLHVHDTTHLAAVTTTWQGNRCLRTTPHKERMSGLVKHRDYPPHTHSYIVNEQYNLKKKRANQEKKQWMARTGN